MLDFDPPTPLPRPKAVEKLVRYSGRLPQSWPVPDTISAAFPLFLYFKALGSIGQYIAARDLRYILGVLHKRSLSFLPEFRDDYFRRALKSISSYCFPKVFSDGPKWMLFVHLHHLTGKAPYSKTELVETISRWVSPLSPSGKTKQFDPVSVSVGLDEIFSRWIPDPNSPQSFSEYADDFLRWGTSGGAPRSELMGEKYRTKWAWAFANATDISGDLLPKPDLRFEVP